MTRYDYATDQAARLARIGLVDEESIAANENAPRVPEPAHRMALRHDIHPAKLTAAKLSEYGEIDGWCDAAMERPMSAVVRFVECRLHYNNMPAFQVYFNAYEAAWKRKQRLERAVQP